MNYRDYKIALLVAVSIVFCSIWSGCTKENDKVCYNGLTVITKVSAETSFPEDEKGINDVVLYIFDEAGRFLESRNTEIDKEEHLFYPDAGRLTVIAWCNSQDGTLDVTPISKTGSIADGLISLKKTRNQDALNIYNSPTDLLHGMAEAKNNKNEEKAVVYVSRKVGAINVTVIGLKEYAGFDDNNYSILIGNTKKTINFLGEPQDGGAAHAPYGLFNTEGKYIVPNFYIPPTMGEELFVKILHNDTEIFMTLKDKDGVPFQIYENATLNVLIDFRGVVSVTVQKSKWSNVFEWNLIID